MTKTYCDKCGDEMTPTNGFPVDDANADKKILTVPIAVRMCDGISMPRRNGKIGEVKLELVMDDGDHHVCRECALAPIKDLLSRRAEEQAPEEKAGGTA